MERTRWRGLVLLERKIVFWNYRKTSCGSACASTCASRYGRQGVRRQVSSFLLLEKKGEEKGVREKGVRGKKGSGAFFLKLKYDKIHSCQE